TNTKHTVIIKGMAFDPAELHAHMGDTVVWINKDLVPHNITDFPKDRWTSGTLALNGSWEKGMSNTLDYYCSIHPTMKGKIIVDP
ncbi:MAG: plastocyanin/azurin family copper-binding protein, partial [Gelidibacter sp.]